MIPQTISLDNKQKIIDFYCGYYHNFLVAENGDIYFWGNSDDKKFGEKYSIAIISPKPLLKLKGYFPSVITLGETISVIFLSSKENSVLRKNIK